jgi:23S rRNA (uracil1939-C5)-methyltransferase
VPITECHVLTPGLLAVVPVLGEITRLGGSRAGVMSFAMTLTDSGVDLRVSGGKPLDGPLRMALGAFAGSFVRLTWEDEPIFAAMPPVGALWGDLRHPAARGLPAGDGAGGGRAAYRRTEAVAGATRIADLFAGCGTFALPLAAEALVHAVEGEGVLLDALDKAARHAQGLKPVTTEVRDLFRRPLCPMN